MITEIEPHTIILSLRSCWHRSINNVLGSKVTLLLGSCGYALYIGSYLCVLLGFI